MKGRSFLTIAFMLGYSIFMMMLGQSTAYYGGQSALFLMLIMSFIASTIVWAIWNLEVKVRERQQASPKKEESLEKRKREHIDSVLRDLSDEDLLRLRRRLLDGTINDDTLEEALVGEDGEMLYRERR